MSHLTSKPYTELIKRLNKYQIGAPDTHEIRKILEILYTKEEAFVGSKFPLGPATLEELAHKTDIAQGRLVHILEGMAQKGIVMDFRPGDTHFFILTPTIFGFFEFTFMRLNSDLPLGELAQLMEQAMLREMGSEFFGSKTPMSRTLIYEKNLPQSKVMSYEQVSHLIKTAPYLSLQACYCRRKAQHLGRKCTTPMDVCMGLGHSADYLVRRGFAQAISVDEMLRVLDKTEELGLVHVSDNVQNEAAFICNCCHCCCELLRGINEFNIIGSVSPTRYMSRIDPAKCNGCGVCIQRCQVRAIRQSYGKQAIVDQQRCIGCSVCASFCPQKAIQMADRPHPPHIPKNQVIRNIKIASEKGRLRHFLFYMAGLFLRGGIKGWK
ncbi:MAG: 4Fe-4S binding protein [Candidatus Schekmanbacteria bacterium]|nr:4Fe-4S binding protein [Candidatus Schekmanbacteria bacterium]